MKIKALYRKNLKMSPGKLAAQVAHAVKNLGITPRDCNIVVLGITDNKFAEKIEELKKSGVDHYVQVDKGLTEIPAGTQTALAWIDSLD